MYKLVLFSAMLLFLNCSNSKKTGNKLTGYYQEYLVALGEASHHKVQCVATFKKDNEDGKPQALPEGFSIFLDETPVPYEGSVYPSYSMELDREGFASNHKWVVKEKNIVVFEMPFSFSTFKINNQVDAMIGSKDVQLSIAGLKDGDELECWFDNIDIDNEIDRFRYAIKDGNIIIPAKDIKSLKKGTYNLKISHIQKKPVMYEGKETGLSDVSYGMNDIPVTIKY